MSTMIEKLEAAESGLSAAAAVNYTTFPNAMPASQEAAPRLGRAYAAGTADQRDVYRCMKELGYQMGEAEAMRTWNATGLLLKARMPQEARAYDLGYVKFIPEIGGTFLSADAEFDPARNRLYVAAVPSDDIRDALLGGTPTRIDGPETAALRIDNVTWGIGRDRNTVKNGEPIEIHGFGITIGSGDEHAALELPDGGGTIPVTLEIPSGGSGLVQRLVGHLAQDVEACKGATLTVWTHGSTGSSQLYAVPSQKLTVLAGDVPPGPTGPLPVVTQVNAQGVDENPVVNTSAVTFIGEHFDDATLKVSYDDGQGGTEEHDLSIYAAGSGDTVLITEDDWYQEAGLSSNFKDLTFTITNANGSTSVTASYQPE